MALVTMVVKPGQHPTEAQIREIEAASAHPVTPDEDAPELTAEQRAEMAGMVRRKKAQAADHTVERL